eukprot:PhM_4_TR1708/c0_g1_i3/m.34427
MGHKWFVFVAHTITSVLAWVRTANVQSDIIIDNVLFCGDRTQVALANVEFRNRCALVGATIGDMEEGTIIPHRGVVLNFADKSVGLKPSWIAKFEERVKATFERSPSAAQLYSLGGMLAWARSVLGESPESDYALWRHLATAARNFDNSPNKQLPWPPVARSELQRYAEWLSTQPVQQVRQEAMWKTLVVTDAAKDSAGASWGGIIVTDTIQLHSGKFINNSASIVHYELAAVAETLARGWERLRNDVVLVTDNTAVQHILSKGRSSAKTLHNLARQILRPLHHAGRAVLPLWVPSAANPADGISRGCEYTAKDASKLHALSEELGRKLEGFDHTQN